MADLQLTNVAKRFGPVNVIDDLSLSVRNGEFLVLVGPSGCGKSTLLRMIAGLESISGGELVIGGERTNDVSPQNRNISMVFQSYALFPHMNVRRNIDFGPRVRGETSETIEKGVSRASKILNLGDYLDRRPAHLSGGQRQRVAMGRSIVRDPKVFLFDEPLSNLDAKLRVQMRTEIKALHQRLGSTIVYVTHDQIEAMTMADRIVVMNGGRIEQVGTPLELYDRPANRFVAGFIGAPAMSFLDGRYETDENGERVVLTNGAVVPVAPCSAENGEAVAVGIRPETYVRDEQGPLALTAEVVEPTGPEIHVFGHIADTEVRAVFRDRLLPEPGETIRLSVPSEHVHLFDATNGVRLGP
ncbi:ABC transporter ATP-binding protein [Pararhizobium mangrovi]|uniref:sn-glycerol-3-phosphate ABC transporter ATP-binding protein UgpC n=1 Tax=Pararhizobium mangrovi TaxID=2590452 RepID=A0A506U781_9HYPH|nr:sn-glycerol-3-phosphate ABC transporter ATP-binding protein UgpC [Pararhizobium mangrovi]TPW30272.1 sn-glycerol-3-phosphate ABC transporter ATP-binding protein UgpC [Pararhizobium mangrovi]